MEWVYIIMVTHTTFKFQIRYLRNFVTTYERIVKMKFNLGLERANIPEQLFINMSSQKQAKQILLISWVYK